MDLDTHKWQIPKDKLIVSKYECEAMKKGKHPFLEKYKIEELETMLIKTPNGYHAIFEFDEQFIEGIDLFQNMTVREAKIASLMAYTEDLEKGTMLFTQGEIGDEMYVVLSGSISIFMDKNGKSTDLVRLEKGNTFGEMGLLR